MAVLKIVGILMLSGVFALATQNSPTAARTDSDTETLRAAVAVAPNDPELHFRLGESLEKSGDLAGAEAEYKKSLALQANNPGALGALAYLYASQRRFPEAETALRSYTALDPKNPKAHVQLGSVLVFSDKKDEASREFSAALGLAPSDPGTLKQIAQLYASHEMYPQAESLYANLTRISPADPDGHYGHGIVLLQLRNFPAAQAELQRAVSLQPNLKEAYGDLAVAAAENKDYAAALRALDARARFLPESAATYFLRATCYDHLKDFGWAADNYKKFLAADGGKSPNQEWQAKHRLVAIEKK
jgi:Flp pilus assembly protein TadD